MVSSLHLKVLLAVCSLRVEMQPIQQFSRRAILAIAGIYFRQPSFTHGFSPARPQMAELSSSHTNP